MAVLTQMFHVFFRSFSMASRTRHVLILNMDYGALQPLIPRGSIFQDKENGVIVVQDVPFLLKVLQIL